MPRLRISLLLMLGSLLLSACGFRLAGYYEVPEELRQVELVIPSEKPSDIRTHLTNLLAVNGIEVRDDAEYRLQLLNENVRRRTLTVSLSADAVEYQLIGTVRFSVFGPDDEVLIEDREVRTERSFDNDENTTARDALEDQVRREIQEQLAQQIVRQYLSLKRAN